MPACSFRFFLLEQPMILLIYIYNRIEQCALPVTTIMALWQLVNLGTRCTVTHCRIALWSHQSAQTASSERCIMQIVNVSLRDSPPNPQECSTECIWSVIYTRIEQCALPVTTIMALWQLVNLGTYGLNQIPHKLAATFWDVCCLKCPN